VKKKVEESFQYISIKETLKSLMKNNRFAKLLASEKSSPFGRYASYIDGSHFKKNAFLQAHKDALRINLYYDDVEVTNPIGSQSSVYKVACFYYTIQNSTSWYNSKLENIFVLAICYSTDLKKYGFQKILDIFLKEMQELESETGVSFYNGNKLSTLRATLVSFIGDTLAAHDILGFSGPGSNLFCRECLISRQKFSKKPTLMGKERKKKLHSRQLELLKESDYHPRTVKKYGLKENSVLNCLKNFHCTKSNVFDPMHDLLEGVVPFSLKCVLKHFIKQRKLFSVVQFNERVNNFRYGVIEKCNKPSPNFTMAMLNSKSKKLKQKSAQTWLLLRVFPFLMGNSLKSEDFKYLELLSTLSKICAITFSPTLTDFHVCELDYLVRHYLTNFKKLFKEETMINKQHHLLHYAKNILLKGPIALYSCMRFESKHLSIKKQIVNAQNFINVPKSVAIRQSLLQSFNIKYHCFTSPQTSSSSFQMISSDILLCKNLIAEKLGQVPLYVKKVKNCLIRGIEFRPNFVMYIVDDENETMYPTFVMIKEIIELGKHLYFACNFVEIIKFASLYNAFEIEETTDFILLEDSEIVDFKPVNIWKKYDSLEKYMNIKYCY
jgi:hypothetical protein